MRFSLKKTKKFLNNDYYGLFSPVQVIQHYNCGIDRDGVFMRKKNVSLSTNKSRRILRIVSLLLCILGIFFSSCATQYSEKMYADVIGFNDNITLSYMLPPTNPKPTDIVRPIPGVFSNEGRPFDLRNPSQVRAMQNAIERIPSGQNTAALYALDIGLDRIVEVNKKYMEKDPNSRYYVVFFTDGIDNASVDMANRTRRGNYPRGATGRDAYGSAMQNRMQNILKNYSFFGLIKRPNFTNPFQSYVLVFHGDDLASYTDEALRTILTPFTASQNALTPEIIMERNMDQLFERFKNDFVIPLFSFSVPKDYVGRRIRMELQNGVRFEADLNWEAKTKCLFLKRDFYTLQNITVSDGFTFKEYEKMIIEMDEDIYDVHSNTVTFTINELKLRDRSYSVRLERVTQLHFDMGNWVENTEYVGTAGGKKNAYILLIMDTSLSLGDNGPAARRVAADIITFISDQM